MAVAAEADLAANYIASYELAVACKKNIYNVMQKKHHFHHLWLILGSGGVYFAIFSGSQEIASGKYWKVITCAILGTLTYFFIEYKLTKQNNES